MIDSRQRRDGAVEIYCVHCLKTLWIVEDDDVPRYLTYIMQAKVRLEK